MATARHDLASEARRTRVLVLVDAIGARVAGAESFAVGLAAALPRERFKVTVCASREVIGDLPDALVDSDLGFLCLERGRDGLKPHAFVRLARRLRRDRIDVLHAHKFGSNVWGTLLGRLCRVPVIVAHEHTWSYEGEPVRRLLDRHLVGRFASVFVAVSSVDAERMTSVEKVPPEKVVVLPTAFIPRPPGPHSDVRTELGLRASEPLLVTAAFLRPQKALDVLIDAFALALNKVPAAHLVIAGTGSCEADLRRHAAASGVADRVHFLGVRNDVAAILETGDVAVMSSDYEGLPLFALECMAHRTPLVSTDVGGIRDILEEDESVLLAPPRDPHALASQIERVLLEPATREKLVAGAQERIAGLTIDQVATRFANLYDRLLEHARGPGDPSR